MREENAPGVPQFRLIYAGKRGHAGSWNFSRAEVFFREPQGRANASIDGVKGENPMSAQLKLPSDIEGLARQVDPLSRRGFFMSSAAAAAAGYTLAAGPVRAQVVTTDTAGLTVGDAKVKVEGGDMPVYFARPANAQNPPVIWWRWRSSACTNTSRM